MPKVINTETLDAVRTGFSTLYSQGTGQAKPQWDQIATESGSSSRKTSYGWLGELPNVREWLGDRVVHGLEEHDYTITNRPWELTIAVDRDDIEDDELGIYGPRFVELGRSSAAHRDQLCFNLLKNGFTEACYDGQSFFDTDHPVLDENGVEQSVSNTGGGSGTPWFLVDSTRALKPIIFQSRRPFEFTAMDNPNDPNVFHKKEFIYGIDSRCNVGFGFWQFAYGSKQTLDADSYEAARVALMEMKGDHGRPLGLMPDLLIVPPSLDRVARQILLNERNADGSTNEFQGTARPLTSPWLA